MHEVNYTLIIWVICSEDFQVFCNSNGDLVNQVNNALVIEVDQRFLLGLIIFQALRPAMLYLVIIRSQMKLKSFACVLYIYIYIYIYA
jgi:hypothetical protein